MTSGITLTKTPNWADVEVTGNVPTNDVTRMSVDASGAAHIMSLLTDLYSDQELAVLREYTSNGIDAHRAAGQTAPIEVHLPSALNPNFIVQDYGTGMSLDDIKYIYSSYGASTKRNDLDQIGAFGLGCKSALTLTQQFAIVSIKDNKRTVAHILRGADGVGEVSIISHTDVNSPNGVKVTIPVPDHQTFTSKAQSFFYTWKSDDVLVNGEKPKTLFDLDHITFTPSNGSVPTAHLIRPAKSRGYYDQFEKGLYVMLSGIRYEIDLNNSAVRARIESDLREFLGQTALIIEIPIGSVDLVPSREALRYSPRTLSNLELFVKGILNDVYSLVVADVVDAPTRRDALIRSKFWSELTRGTARLAFKWGTEEIPKSISLNNLNYLYFERSSRSDSGYMQRRTDYRSDDADAAKNVNVQALAASTNVFYTVDKREPDEIRGYKSMFRDYLLGEGISLNNATLFHLRTAPTSEWFKSLTTEVKIDTMLAKAKAHRDAVRAAAPKSTLPKVEVYYDLIDVAADGSVTCNRGTAASEIPAGSYYIQPGVTSIDDQLAFFIRNRGGAQYTSDIENNKHVRFVLGQALVGGGTIVIVDRARKVEALKNRTSNVVDTDFYALYRATANRLIGGNAADNAAISQVLSFYASSRISPREFAQSGLLELAGTIDDPEIGALLTLLNSKTNYTRERIKYLRVVAGTTYTQQDETGKKTEALMDRINVVLDKYPLLGVLSGKTHKRSAMLNDLVEYLNTTYGKANKA